MNVCFAEIFNKNLVLFGTPNPSNFQLFGVFFPPESHLMGKDWDCPTKFFLCNALAAATELLLNYCLLFNLVLYTRIVSCVLLRSGLGSPTDIGVVREATGKVSKHFL